MSRLDAILNTPTQGDERFSWKRKNVVPRIKCKDGTTLSVQASAFHYCTPRNHEGPWTSVEVGFLDVAPPEIWAEYADGEYPADVYGCVPVELVREYIEAHGGEA